MSDSTKKTTVYYVEFFAPGSFVAESWTQKIKSPDPHMVKWPKDAYAFQMHQRDEIHDGGETFLGKSKRIGPTYYHPDSKVETLAEVRGNPKASRTLIENMECNKWNRIVWTRWGNWPQPYDPKDDVVLTSAKMAEESA